MKIKWLALTALGLAAAAPAEAQMVRAQDPQSLVKALQAEGFTAKLGTDSTGDPMITSASSGTRFQIIFYGCEAARNCATVQFNTGYDLKEPVSLETMNAWNKASRFARAFRDDEGDPILQMDLDLDDGGVSQALFIDNLQFWTSLVSGFEKHIGYRK